MVAGDRNVGNPDFALVSATDLYAVLRDVLDDHHVVGLLGDALQHQVRPHWLLDGQQFEVHAVLLDEARVLFLADLAVELLKVVLECATDHLLLHLGLVPLLEAAEVHQPAGAAALAGRAQELPQLSALGHHAVLALQHLILAFGCDGTNYYLLGVHPELGLHFLFGVGAVVDRRDQVFHPAELYDLPGR